MYRGQQNSRCGYTTPAGKSPRIHRGYGDPQQLLENQQGLQAREIAALLFAR